MANKILVVDDEQDVVEVICDRLEFEGFETLRAYNGAEAFNVLSKAKPDIMILDLMMPILSGIDLLKQMEPYPGKLPTTIALSAVEESHLRAEALNYGAKVFFPKPCDMDVLVARIRSFLQEQE